MKEKKKMKILGEFVTLSHDNVNIFKLKFLKDNPRVYASTHGITDFDKCTEEEKQEIIYKKLIKEPSVENLLPEVKRHGGLMESILIRHDTMEVIEGNSRLAVYRKLHEEANEQDKGNWEQIQCDMVSSLTEPQQAAFLNQIHVKGKTKWSAFEKANFSYVRRKKGEEFSDIAELFGESQATIRTRFNAVNMMKDNKDDKRSHFSYYDVLVRNKEIANAIKKSKKLQQLLLGKIKKLDDDDENADFTAKDLRDKLPVILKKPKVLKDYESEKIDLELAYQLAKPSGAEQKVKQAKAFLKDISREEISKLQNKDKNRFNVFRQEFRRLCREIERIKKMIEKIVEKIDSTT